MNNRIILFASAIACSHQCLAVSINVTGLGSYSQSFDTLASSGSSAVWLNDSSIEGWYLYRQPSPGSGITTYNAGTGSSSAGSYYSFGSSGSTDRALGGVGAGTAYFGSPSSGAVAGWIAASFLNGSGGMLDNFTAKWNGEQWRSGGTSSGAQTMVFEYGFGDTFETVATWNTPGGTFNWASPIFSSAAAAVDGNGAGRLNDVGGTINSISWASGQTLWLRWNERNDLSDDHGLAIDNFNFSARKPVVVSSPVPDRLPVFVVSAFFAFLLSLSQRLNCRVGCASVPSCQIVVRR